MTYGLFLGCIAPLRYPGIEGATREILGILEIGYKDLENAACCPAPGVTRSFDQSTWLALAARNLVLAEQQGVEILTICNGCYGSLFETAHMLNSDEKLRARINKILKEAGLEYNGTAKVRHLVEVLNTDVGLEKIAGATKNKQNLNVAVHYGCHFLKPSKYKRIDDPEAPAILDKMVEATGAKSISYKDKQMCCGSGGGVRARSPDVALEMTKNKLDNLKKTDAQCIVTPCPFCHLQYDRGQKELGVYNYPVLHIAQLLAMAFEVPVEKLGFGVHEVSVDPIL